MLHQKKIRSKKCNWMKHGTKNVPNVLKKHTSKLLNLMRMATKENPMVIAMSVSSGLGLSLTPSFMQHHWKQKGREGTTRGEAPTGKSKDTEQAENPGLHPPDPEVQQEGEAGPLQDWNMPQQGDIMKNMIKGIMGMMKNGKRKKSGEGKWKKKRENKKGSTKGKKKRNVSEKSTNVSIGKRIGRKKKKTNGTS